MQEILDNFDKTNPFNDSGNDAGNDSGNDSGNDAGNVAGPKGPDAEASVTQRTYDALRAMIVTGKLKPGEKLKIEVLRQKLDTGGSPIREALSLLTSDNLVERMDKRGFRAAPISQSNFEEILMLRCELEDIALRRSISARTVEWEEEIVLSHHRMLRAQADASDDFEYLHKKFHMSLLANCQAPVLQKFCSQLYDLNIRYRYLAGGSVSYEKRDIGSEHEMIMQKAISGNADEAAQVLLAHYQKTGAFLVEQFGENVSS